MKQQNHSDYIIAAVVVGCSIIMLAALTIALSGFRLAPPSRTVQIEFESVAGIRINSQVRYAGIPIGKIIAMTALNPEQRMTHPELAVRVTAELFDDAPPLYEGTTASITSDTVLAEKFVDLNPLSMEGREPSDFIALADGAIIRGDKVIGFDELTREGYEAVGYVNKILSQLDEDYPDFHTRLGSLITHAEETMVSADSLAKRLDQLIRDKDPEIQALIDDMSVVSKNLKVTTTYSKAVSATLAKRPWRLVWGGEVNQLPTEREILNSDQPITWHHEEATEQKDKKSSAKTKSVLHRSSSK